MSIFRDKLHLGRKVPQMQTDDYSDKSVTREKLSKDITDALDESMSRADAEALVYAEEERAKGVEAALGGRITQEEAVRKIAIDGVTQGYKQAVSAEEVRAKEREMALSERMDAFQEVFEETVDDINERIYNTFSEITIAIDDILNARVMPQRQGTYLQYSSLTSTSIKNGHLDNVVTVDAKGVITTAPAQSGRLYKHNKDLYYFNGTDCVKVGESTGGGGEPTEGNILYPSMHVDVEDGHMYISDSGLNTYTIDERGHLIVRQ